MDLQMRIKDAAIGQTDSNLKEAAPVHQFALQVSVGYIRFNVPCRSGIGHDLQNPQTNRFFRLVSNLCRFGAPRTNRASRRPVLVVILAASV